MTGYAIPYAAALPAPPQPDIEEGQHYQLLIRQQPRRTRAAHGTREKDRRPVDPPPILQFNVSTEFDRARNFLHNPYYFMCCSLLHEMEDRQEPAEYLCGTTVSSQHRLKDLENRDGAFFVFGDLSIKPAGRYRLQFSLFEIIKDPIGGLDNWVHCRSIQSEPFESLLSKDWPGMEESTPLSRSFSDQGVRLRIRKESRSVFTKRVISEMQAAYQNPHIGAAVAHEYGGEPSAKRKRTSDSGPQTGLPTLPSAYSAGPSQVNQDYPAGRQTPPPQQHMFRRMSSSDRNTLLGSQPAITWEDNLRGGMQHAATRAPNPYLPLSTAQAPNVSQSHDTNRAPQEGYQLAQRSAPRQLPYPSRSQAFQPQQQTTAIYPNTQLPPLHRPSHSIPPPISQQGEYASNLPRQLRSPLQYTPSQLGRFGESDLQRQAPTISHSYASQQPQQPQQHAPYPSQQYTPTQRQQYTSTQQQHYTQPQQQQPYEPRPPQQQPYAPNQQAPYARREQLYGTEAHHPQQQEYTPTSQPSYPRRHPDLPDFEEQARRFPRTARQYDRALAERFHAYLKATSEKEKRWSSESPSEATMEKENGDGVDMDAGKPDTETPSEETTERTTVMGRIRRSDTPSVETLNEETMERTRATRRR